MRDVPLNNVRRYLPFQVMSAIYAWMPVFFLYFSATLSLREVLLLEAIYYAGVVIVEVPSGYFSDRFGRCVTLRIATGLLTLAYALFIIGDSFIGFACAQIALAAGLAFQSGTDTSFHYDSLEDVGLEGEYGEREARIASLLLVTGSLSGIAGGALSLIDFRLAYALSGFGALGAFVVAWTFKEPNAQQPPDDSRAGTFSESLLEIYGYLRSQPLRWLFAFFVAATVINHVPYEFYQPILRDLDLSITSTSSATLVPLFAGVHLAIAQLIAAPFANISQRMATRFGVLKWLLGSLLIQAALIAAMALWIHPTIALLLLVRSIPGAMQRAPIRAGIMPRVHKRHRATFQSIMSLVGRLAFALLLAILAGVEHTSVLGITGLQLCLMICTLLSLVALISLSATARRPDAPLERHT